MRTLSFCLVVVFAHAGCGESDSPSGTTPVEQAGAIRDAGGLATPECTTEADCQTGEACNMGTCGPPIISETCQSANDCPAGEICNGGRCEPAGGCTGDGDCPMGSACVDGACAQPGCMSDQDCPAGQLCQGGACVVDEGACVDNIDCAANEACIGGRCEASERCAMNADCPPGQICENERCTEQVSGCRDDSECGPNADCIDGACVAGGPCADCPEDTRCINDMCVPIERCSGDGDCPAGQVCSAGECVPEGGGGGLPCGRDEDCLPLFACINAECVFSPSFAMACVDDSMCLGNQVACVDGICGLDFGGGEECQIDADCGVGEVCENNACVPDEGQLGDPCDFNFDCAAGLECLEGVCAEPAPMGCAGDRDCAAGEVCVAGECVPDPAQPCMNDFDCNGDRCIDGVCVLPCIDDDECLFDQVCRDGGCVENDGPAPAICDAPTAIRAGQTLMGSTEAGASQSTGSCVGNSAGPEAVFEYFSLTDGAVCASTNGSDFDTVLYVREEQCGADAAELECNDDSGFDVALRPQSAIQFLAELGTRYFIFVDGYDADDFGDLALALTEGPCEGEPCDADRRINLGDTLIGELVGESVHRGSCAGGGPELIYEFSTNQAGAVCVSTGESMIDTVLYIRQADCAVGEEVACDDDDGPGLTSQITFNPEIGETYFIFVDSFAAAGGQASLSIQPGACP